MVKEVLAALLLIALLIAAIFNIGIVNNLTDEITKTVEQAVAAAESGRKTGCVFLRIPWNLLNVNKYIAINRIRLFPL